VFPLTLSRLSLKDLVFSWLVSCAAFERTTPLGVRQFFCEVSSKYFHQASDFSLLWNYPPRTFLCLISTNFLPTRCFSFSLATFPGGRLLFFSVPPRCSLCFYFRTIGVFSFSLDAAQSFLTPTASTSSNLSFRNGFLFFQWAFHQRSLYFLVHETRLNGDFVVTLRYFLCLFGNFGDVPLLTPPLSPF